MNINSTYYSAVAIRHNSEILHSKLDALGFKKLKWTTNSDADQLLVAMRATHRQDDFPAYWNNGIGEAHDRFFKEHIDAYDCGNNEKIFLILAKKIVALETGDYLTEEDIAEALK